MSNPNFGTPSRYAFDNSVSAACRNNPAGCAELTGTSVAPTPGLTVASAGYTVHQVVQALDNLTRDGIEEALKKCADEARSELLLRYSGNFAGISPTAQECMEWVKDTTGRRVTWAMRLGQEMHEVALKCAEQELSRLRPGGFGIEPRYLFDLATGERRLVSRETERALEESGNGGELKGSIKPDVVIHAGDPLKVQAIYDFKFPCVNTDRVPQWGSYPEDHPYGDFNQGEVYEKALGCRPARVVPRLGVAR